MRPHVLSLALFACCVLTPAPAAAQVRLDLNDRLADPLANSPQQDLHADRRRGQSSFSPADAARQVQSLYGGRVLAVQPDSDGYRVKVLKDGEVRIYSVSPQE